MIIEEDYGNDYYGNLVIENYPNLQLIIVKNDSLNFLNSLKICNCENLKTIETNSFVFYYVKNVIIESIFEIHFLCRYLPNLQSFITGSYSFYNTTSLSLSSRIFLFSFM